MFKWVHVLKRILWRRKVLSLGGSPNEAGCWLLARLGPAEYESVPSVD